MILRKGRARLDDQRNRHGDNAFVLVFDPSGDFEPRLMGLIGASQLENDLRQGVWADGTKFRRLKTFYHVHGGRLIVSSGKRAGRVAKILAHSILTHSHDSAGERNGHAKLTLDMVNAIRKRLAGGEGLRPIALEYKVGKDCIWKIKLRKTWK